MDLLPKYLNGLSGTTRPKRLQAYTKLLELCSAGELAEQEEFDLLRECLRGFEDSAERCREYAIQIVSLILVRQPASILDWVLPAVVTRIGVSPVAEESEELRLLLLKLAVLCMETFPHEIGPRSYIDFMQVLLENCLKDAYPDLKKEACRACARLCEIEPVLVKHVSLPLARAVKTCLLHKHSVVRAEAVRTLAALIQRGAVEILADSKDEPVNRTTTWTLFVLANDHVEAVRSSVVDMLSVCFLDILERQDQHRRLLPHLLLLLTDHFPMVSQKALQVLESMGDLYLLDNEDNTTDITKRRVTMKDIEWYGDEEYPDMTLTTVDIDIYPILQRRPSLGSRYVVAESLRGFIEGVFADVSAVDWIVPFSSNNRRVVALRILWISIYHAEKSVVQFVEQILAVLYKALRDNQDVVQECLICLEILGKFLTPEQYLPFLISEGTVKEAEVLQPTVVQTRSKTVIVSSINGETVGSPTLFSTAAASVKCSILVSFRYLIEGSKALLSASHATQIVRTFTKGELLECDSEPLLCSLLDTLDAVIAVLAERNFVTTPSNPLPLEVREDVNQRTLDSMLLYAFLCLRSSPFPSVQERVSRCTEHLSMVVTGVPYGIYKLHFKRLLFRYGNQMPVSAFSDLVLNSENIEEYGIQLSDIFLVKLSDIDLTQRATNSLQYLRVLEELLWRKAAVFSRTELEQLLRVVVLPLAAFRAGGQAHLFRKVAVSSLCATLEECHRRVLEPSLRDNDLSLSSKVTTTWCNASDSDDPEMRLVCMVSVLNLALLPMNAGSANDILQSIILRMDDSNDLIRAKAASGLLAILESKDDVCSTVVDGIISQVVPMTKKLLIHLDDHDERVGLKPILVSVLKQIALLAPSSTKDLVMGSMVRHQVPDYCQEILHYIESL